jgi:hypothetical protein
MHKEVVPIPTLKSGESTYTYMPAQTIEDIASAMRRVLVERSTRFALVKMTLLFDSEKGNRLKHTSGMQQSMHYFLADIRALVRRTDPVFLLQNAMYFVLPTADIHGGLLVQERLWEALLWCIHNKEVSILAPCRIHAGYSAYPEPCQDIYQCIHAAGVVCRTFDFSPVMDKDEEGVQDKELPALARKLGIPYLTSLPRQLPSQVWQLVSPHLACELRCYPLGHERDVLTVAMSDPQDKQVIERLCKETGLRIFPVLTHPDELQVVLERLAPVSR